MRVDVLLVEDDSALRNLVVQVLQDAGYSVTAVAHPEAALSRLTAAADGFPRLLLLDWGPHSSPQFMAAYRQLRAPTHTPIVVVTAGPDVIQAAVENGATGFLHKPFDLGELEAIVRRFLAPVPTRVLEKHTAREAERQRRLRQLRQEARRLRDEVAANGEGIRQLLAVESQRSLSADETAQVRVFREQGERLRLELQTLWQEFEAIRQTKVQQRPPGGMTRALASPRLP
jgi:DNA-binding response OmpR family regulator